MASPGYTPEKINRKKHNNHSKCLIHYDTIQYSDNLIAIDEVRYAEIVSAKECRMKLGANHLHHEQVTRVPPGYKTGLFYHRECYQNFTKARSLLRKREPLKELCPKPNITHGEETGRPRRSHEIDSAGRFPDHCWFCKGKKAKRIRTRTCNCGKAPVCKDNTHESCRETKRPDPNPLYFRRRFTAERI